MRLRCCFGFSTLTALVLGSAVSSKDLPKDTITRKDAILKRFHEEFVTLVPGEGKFRASFMMGAENGGRDNEKPAHKVTLKKPFNIAKYEVTQELWFVVTGKNPAKWVGARNSVEMVSWTEANEFCRKVTGELQRLKLITADQAVRLPTEAEWEYACRAGTTTAYSFGDQDGDLGKYAWYKPNSPGNDPPVGQKLPNAWGLFDMHGYVSEWCADFYHPDYKNAPNDGFARAKLDREERVIRGGSFADPADMVRSAFRAGLDAAGKSDKIGFRCVLSTK